MHGGITYGDRCRGEICHVAQPGESDDVWWVGFDCNHSGDLSLHDVSEGRTDTFNGHWMESYKTVGYARAETEQLAEQAAALAHGDAP